MEPPILRTPGGTVWQMVARRAKGALEQQPMPTASVDFQRVKLSARDWFIALAAVVGNTVAVVLWVDKQFSEAKVENAKLTAVLSEHDRALSEIRTVRDRSQAETNAKLDQINTTLTTLSVKIAEIAVSRARP